MREVKGASLAVRGAWAHWLSTHGSHALTAARIRDDLPDLPMAEAVELNLVDDDNTPAVRFVSHDPVLGDIGETWFRKNGYLVEVSVTTPDREL